MLRCGDKEDADVIWMTKNRDEMFVLSNWIEERQPLNLKFIFGIKSLIFRWLEIRFSFLSAWRQQLYVECQLLLYIANNNQK